MNTVLEKLFDIQDLKINQDQDKKSTILTFDMGTGIYNVCEQNHQRARKCPSETN